MKNQNRIRRNPTAPTSVSQAQNPSPPRAPTARVSDCAALGLKYPPIETLPPAMQRMIHAVMELEDVTAQTAVIVEMQGQQLAYRWENCSEHKHSAVFTAGAIGLGFDAASRQIEAFDKVHAALRQLRQNAEKGGAK